MSRRPGIGRDWYDQYSGDVFPSDEVPVPGKGVFKKAPRFYETILQAESPDAFEEVKKLRKVFREQHGEEYTTDRLMQKYKVKKAQLRLKETKKHGYDTR